jgi:hypothetical protein
MPAWPAAALLATACVAGPAWDDPLSAFAAETAKGAVARRVRQAVRVRRNFIVLSVQPFRATRRKPLGYVFSRA